MLKNLITIELLSCYWFLFMPILSYQVIINYPLFLSLSLSCVYVFVSPKKKKKRLLLILI